MSVSMDPTGQFQVAYTGSNNAISPQVSNIYLSKDYGATWASIYTGSDTNGFGYTTSMTQSAGQILIGYKRFTTSGANYTFAISGQYSSFPTTAIGYSKTFVIDHPEDQHRYLVHACLEGPEAGVYYRGDATIPTGSKSIRIDLPSYVRALATDFTIQITPIYNASTMTVPQYVTSRVVDNAFTVYGPPGEFFWHVHGKRMAITIEPRKNDVFVHGEGPYRWIA